jgi:hypothetical protein
MTVGATLVTSLLATLAHPPTWILALGGFLIRGGIVAFLIPIFVFPTPVGLANMTGPTVIDFVLGGPSVGLLAILLFVVVAAMVWIVFGGFLAATLEIEGIRIVAADEDVAAAAPSTDDVAEAEWRAAVDAAPAHAFDPTRQALRIVAARMAMLFPLLVAVIWASARIVAAAYAELTLPSDVTVPIAWRIVATVPDAIVVVIIVWLIGEILGGIAARRIAIDGASITGGLVGAVTQAVRHPVQTLVLFGAPAVVMLLVLIPSGGAASVAWAGLRAALVDRNVVLAALMLVVFVALWAGGLALASVVAAWRQAAWTVDAVRRGHRTFGGSASRRPGDWNAEGGSGRL